MIKTIKCIVNANKEQLLSIGIDRDIMACEVTYVGDYGDGYVSISVEAPKEIKDVIGDKAQPEQYSIFKHWITVLTNN